MGLRAESFLTGAALLLLSTFTVPPAVSGPAAEPALRLRWSLSNATEFFAERPLDDPAAPRQFRLDWEKAKQEGVKRCAGKGLAKGPAAQPSEFCAALAARMLPVFSYAFDQPGATLILDSIDVQCFRISRRRSEGGVGFVKDNAAYDVLLPGRVETVHRTPGKALTFSDAGTAELRLWPDFAADLAEGGAALDLEIRFHFRSEHGTAEVGTGRFTLVF